MRGRRAVCNRRWLPREGVEFKTTDSGARGVQAEYAVTKTHERGGGGVEAQNESLWKEVPETAGARGGGRVGNPKG